MTDRHFIFGDMPEPADSEVQDPDLFEMVRSAFTDDTDVEIDDEDPPAEIQPPLREFEADAKYLLVQGKLLHPKYTDDDAVGWIVKYAADKGITDREDFQRWLSLMISQVRGSYGPGTPKKVVDFIQNSDVRLAARTTNYHQEHKLARQY